MRKDIQALRALAVLGVVAFHADLFPFSRGYLGVDIFFVISGYLIIGLLLEEVRKTNSVNVVKFLARRARRLIPAASVVLMCTVIATLILMPGLSGRRVFSDVQAASLYFANIHFGFTATNYWADHAVSPVLHFWSLGVEEQFYIAFPVLLLGVCLLNVFRNRVTLVIGLVLAIVTVTSFWFMNDIQSTSPEWAFYHPLSRVWEFSIGGLAVATSSFVTKQSVAKGMQTFLGVGSLVSFGLMAWWTTSFHNPWTPNTTELPAIVLATASTLIAGSVQPIRFSLESLVDVKVIQWLGRISYSTYLWHWPVLFFGLKVLDLESQAIGNSVKFASVALILCSLILAHYTYRFIENPIRNHPHLISSARNSLLVGFVLSISVVTIAAGVSRFAPARLSTQPVEDLQSVTKVPDFNSEHIQKLIKRYAPQPSAKDVEPVSSQDIEQALNDFPVTNADGCFVGSNQNEQTHPCTYGRGLGLISLVGSSHSNQFFPAVLSAARQESARLLVHLRAGCTLANVTYALNGKPWSACNAWKEEVLKDLITKKPQLVVMVPRTQTVIDPLTNKTASAQRQRELFIYGLNDIVQSLTNAGIKVLIIRDTPYFDVNPIDCLSSHVVEACTQSLDRSLASSDAGVVGFGGMLGVVSVDLSQALCSGDICPAVRAGNIVWRDRDHITNAYAEKLSALFGHLVRLSENSPNSWHSN